MNWLTNFVRPKLRALVARKEVPDNLWVKCPKCEQMLFTRDWEANQDPTYADYREQLRRQSKKLIDQAGTRNLEGATYAYLGVLSTCVDCHSHCRDVLKIASDIPQLRAIPIPTTASSDDEAVTR